MAWKKLIEGTLGEMSFRPSFVDPCLWMNTGGLIVYLLRHKTVRVRMNSGTVAKRNASASPVGSPENDCLSRVEIIRTMGCGCTIRTAVETTTAGLASLPLERCNGSKLAGSSRALDDEPLDTDAHSLFRRVVGLFLFFCGGHRADVSFLSWRAV